MTVYPPIPDGELDFYLDVAESRAEKGEATGRISHGTLISMICEIKHLRALCAARGEDLGAVGEDIDYIDSMVETYSSMAGELHNLSIIYRQKAARLGYKRTQLKNKDNDNVE